MPLTYSSRFVAAVKKSHKIRSYVQLVAGGVLQPQTFGITGGNAKEDATADIRTQASCKFIDKSGLLIPSASTDILYPGVNELKFFRGVVYPDGTYEDIPLGVFGFEDVNIHDSGDAITVDVECFDRSKKVSNARFSDVWVVASGTTVATAILAIVAPRISGLQTSFSYEATNTTVKATQFDRGDDPWKACMTLADAGGLEVLFGRDGELIIRAVPSSSADPKWTFADGSEAVVIEVTKSLSVSEFNHTYEIAEGGDITTPFYAEARDEWSIAYTGDRPTFHVSSLYTSVGQCQAAADAKLEKVRGTVESVNLQIIPNPAIATGDVCQITNARTKTTSASIIDKVTTPLEANNGQYLGVRKRTVG